MAFQNLRSFTDLHTIFYFFFSFRYSADSGSPLTYLTYYTKPSILQLFWLSLPCLSGLYRKQKAQKITDVFPSVSLINALRYKGLV